MKIISQNQPYKWLMVGDFVELFLLRRKKIAVALKTSLVLLVVFLLLSVIERITSTLVINRTVNNVIEEFAKNEDNKVNFRIEKDFLRSKVAIKDLYVSVNTGTVDIAEMIIKKRSGFFIPSVVSVVPKGIVSSSNNGRKYDILSKRGEIEALISVNRSLIKKPTFGGIKFNQPVNFILLENGNDVGDINIDVMDLVVNEIGTYMNYKGSLIFHDGDFVPSVIVLDRPFRWDVKIFESKETKKTGLYSPESEVVNNLSIERMVFDFDFSQVSISGKSTYGSKLYATDIKTSITNDDKFVDAVFNMMIQTREDDVKIFKKMRKILKGDIIPQLKKNSESTKKVLHLSFKKLEKDDDVVVNNTLSMTDIVNKLAGI